MATPLITNNTPVAGSISWGPFVIKYEGDDYALDAAFTDERWVWWRYNAGAPIIEAGDVVPEDLTDDDMVLFANKGGVGVRIQSSSLIDGELIVNGSIFAEALSVHLINSDHIVTAGLDAAVIKFGEMSGERIEAQTITAEQIAGRTITALEIASHTITAEEIMAHSITAEEIEAHSITAEEIEAHTITALEIASHTITAEEVSADIIVANEIFAQDGYFGSVEASQIQTGELEAAIALLGSLNVGQISINPITGITIPQPGGGQIVFPTDGTSATFSGVLTAIQQLSVSGVTTLNNLVKLGAVMSIGAGVSDPQDKATAVYSWDSFSQNITGFPPGQADESKWYGLCDTPDGLSWVYVSEEPYLGGAFICVRNKSDHLVTLVKRVGDGLGGARPFSGNGGITRVGNEYFVLGRGIGSSPDGGTYSFYAFDLNFDYLRRSTHRFDPDPLYKRPAIGTDGTSLYQVSGGNNTYLEITKYAAANFAFQNSYSFAHGGNAAFDVAGIYVGSAGTAAQHFWVQSTAGPCLVYRVDTFARATIYEFVRAGGNTPRGLAWDGTRFWNLDANARMWKYSEKITTDDYDVAWAAVDASTAGGTQTHITGPSPRQRVTWPARSMLLVNTPSAPEVHLTGTGNDIADRTAVYMAWPTNTTLHLQPYNGGLSTIPAAALPVGVTASKLGTADLNSATPLVNQFAGVGGQGSIKSIALLGGMPVIELNGSGGGRVGPLEWEADGDIVNNSTFVDPIPWTNLSILSGWTAVGTQVPQYKRDAAGVVHVRGAVTRTTASSGDAVFILPGGARPIGDSVRGVGRGSSTSQLVQWAITTGGTFSLTWTGTNPTTAGVDCMFSSLG